jgi:hypothetical protein
MKQVLTILTFIAFAQGALAGRYDSKQAIPGLSPKTVRGCYLIEIRNLFVSMDYHINVPGDGTLSFIADTKNQGTMPKACTGQVAYAETTAQAQISCAEMIAESKARGKEYVWEKDFKMDLNFAKAQMDGSNISKVKAKLIQGSNGSSYGMTVKLIAETCR